MFLQILMNGLIAGSIYALLAMGFALIYANTKFFNMAHGAMTTVGGYAVYYLGRELGWNIYPSVVLGVLVAGIMGYLLNLGIFERIKQRKSSNTVLLVASLGAMIIIQSFVAILFTNQFQTLSDNSSLEKLYNIGSAVVTQTQVGIFISAVVIFIALLLVFKFTRFGKMMLATSDDEKVAEIIGVNTRRIIRQVFFIGSAIAGLAGIWVGFDTGLEPIMGMNLLLKGVIATIIGGLGQIQGAFLGAFLLGLVENFGIWKISGEWKDAIAFGLLIIFLLFRPKGILNKK